MADSHKDQHTDAPEEDLEVPTLTDMVATEVEDPFRGHGLNEEALEQLRSDLTTRTVDLASRLMHGALRDMEAALLEQVLDRLQQQLPELVDQVIAEQLADSAARASELGADE